MTNKLSVNNRNSIGLFMEGSSGNPNGRPLGSKNLFTTLKSAFIDAFEELDEVYNLVEWAKYNQTDFHEMLARLMPREIHANVNPGVSLAECLRVIDERGAMPDES